MFLSLISNNLNSFNQGITTIQLNLSIKRKVKRRRKGEKCLKIVFHGMPSFLNRFLAATTRGSQTLDIGG